MGRESVIERRIRAGLAKVAARNATVRAIYLSPADRAALDKLASRRWGSGAAVHRFSFDDHPLISNDKCLFDGHEIRDGKTSRIYDTHGVGTDVPTPRKPPRRKRKARGERVPPNAEGLRA
jgi:hypothetical protein